VIDRLPAPRRSATSATHHRRDHPAQRPAAVRELNAAVRGRHNGNLTNGLTLRRELVRNGAMMQSTTDTEVILHLVAQSKRNRFIDRFIEALARDRGRLLAVSLTNKKLIGARDPLGIRPLVLGELDGCPILASETCALDIIGAKYVRDVEPASHRVRRAGAQSHNVSPKPRGPASSEYIYFSRGFHRRRAVGV